MEEELSGSNNGGKLRKLENNNNGCHNNQDDVDVEEDILSSLFDPLLVEILSFLPIESAAATSALSRRWRYLWTQITSLRFCSGKHLSAVDHILPQLTSPLIRTLVMPVAASDGRLTRSITSCFDHIRRRNDIEVIEVNVNDSEIILPAWVLQCQSLVCLDLYSNWNFELVRSCDLPNLKKLSLQLDYSATNLIGILFKSCPLLEDLWVEFLLSLENDEHLVDISAPNLKYLTIVLTDWGPLRLKFVINAPKLLQLSIDDYYSSSYYSFVTIPSTLAKAHLSLLPDGEDAALVPNLVQAFSSVCSLDLRDCSKMINYLVGMDASTLPIFRNLTLLEVDFDNERGCWKRLLLSLRCLPNLVILKVTRHPTEEEDWSGLESLPTHSISKLKILEIRGLPLYDSDTQLIGYILSNGNSLERLSLDVIVVAKQKEVRLWKEYEFCESFFKLPRSSSTCEIEFHGAHIHASSTHAFSDGFLACHLRYGAPKD